jgi:hypothetical protein
VSLFCICWWDVSDGFQQAAVFKPIDPFERFLLESCHGFSWTKPVDDLSFVEAVYRFGQGVIVRVTNAANRGLDPREGQPLGIANGQILGGFNRSTQHLNL